MNGGFPDGSVVKNPLAKQEMWVWSLGRDVPLEKEMATHSSILACDIPWTEEPGRLQSMDSHTEHTETVYSWGQRDFNAKLTSNF